MTKNTQNINECIPLSSWQKGIWVDWKLAPDSPKYNTCLHFKIEGNLNIQKLKESCLFANTLFDTHRAQIIEQDNRPFIIFHEDDNKIFFEEIDIKDKNLDSREVLAIIRNYANQPFDLLESCKTRYYITKIGENAFCFSIISHHILSDAHSGYLISKVISDYYNDNISEIQLLRKTNTNYRNFIHQHSEPYTYEEHAKFWESYTKGSQILYDLNPISDCTKNKPTNKYHNRFHFNLDKDSTAKLKKLCKAQKSTIFTTLISLFNILLFKYNNQNNITIGFPHSFRTQKYNNCFGFFVCSNMICFSNNPSDTLEGVVNETKKSFRQIKPYRKIPTYSLAQALRADSQASSLPNINIVETIFKRTALNLSQTSIDVIEIGTGNNSDFSLLYDCTEQLELAFLFNNQLISKHMIERISIHFINLIKTYISSPNTTVIDVELLSKKEKETLSSIENPYPFQFKATLLHELFESQTLQQPDKTALIMGNELLSYKQLHEISNQFGHYLSKLLPKNKLFGVALKPSFKQIITLLAISKAGGTYVPLSNSIPPKRLEVITKQLSLDIIITEETFQDQNSEYKGRFVDISSLEKVIINQPKKTLNVSTLPDSPAYIIFTSGSTGTPKGVAISHEFVSARLKWLTEYFKPDNKEIVLNNIQYTFDPSIYEIFWPLSFGGTIVIPENEENKLPEALISLIQKNNITFMNIIPSFLSKLMSTEGFNACSSLKNIISGGESLSPDLVKLFYSNSTANLYNMYGPTEATIFTTCFNTKFLKPNSQYVPIGKPVGGVKCYITDKGLNILPPGITGELCISGLGITKNYINTQSSKFIQNKFSQDNEEPLYRTGDLAKLNEQGELIFLGRTDNQIKHKGYRFELGEIEHKILKQPHVINAFVEYKSNKKLLIAYIESSNNSVDEVTLKNNLGKELPAYMLPNHYIILKKFPLLPNGKLNTKELIDSEFSTSNYKMLEYNGNTQKTVASIWSKLLNKPVNSIDPNTSFFEAGGDSLLAIELALILSKSFSVNVATTEIFNSPTIHLLTSFLQQENTHSQTKRSVLNIKNKRAQYLSVKQKRRLFSHAKT